MSADSRLSEFVQQLEQVSKEGPRTIWRKPGHLVWAATCDDCDSAITFTSFTEAEDWIDIHDCVSAW